MKLLIIISLSINTLLFAQTDKLERLKQLLQEGKITYTYLGDDIYQLTYPDGTTTQMYFGKAKKQDTDTIPTTVIDTWNVDTMLYRSMYPYWVELPTATLSGYQLIIGDANKNNLPEIYAPTRDYDDPPDLQNMQVFEIDSSGGYTSKFTYADSIAVLSGLYDINRDGKLELLTRRYHWTNEFIFFKCDSLNEYPTKLDFVYSDYPNQKDDPTFGDFDKNGKTDLVFFFLDQIRRVVICEFDSIINNFNTICEITDTTRHYQGFAVGDFDMDGKTDIVFGGVYGEVNVIESEGEHNYKRVFITNTGGTNSFMMMPTNDLNNNGKPEFWVSSTTYIGLTDVLRFSCYETTGDNSYQEVSRIDFLNIFPFYASNSFSSDVDKDGKDELVICFDEHVFIIKCISKHNPSTYNILYMIRNNTGGGYDGASMYDLNNDGYPDLLIHRGKYNNNGDFKSCTDVYKSEFLLNIQGDTKASLQEFSLQQNYPNPFNPNTTIVYNLPISTKVRLMVCDILGNEIAVLEEGEKTAGKHTINWNGKDKFQNQVSSGIYFINLTTPNYNKTIKGVMLK